MQRARRPDVIDVLAPAGQEAWVLQAANPLSDYVCHASQNLRRRFRAAPIRERGAGESNHVAVRAARASVPVGRYPRDRAGVDRQRDAGHERCLIRAQPDDGGGDLGRVAEAGHRLRREDLLLALGRLIGHQRRHDRARDRPR